jgi:septal ring factor EnvC (AmiA/AmiB activator)
MWIKSLPGLLFSFLPVFLLFCAVPAARTEERQYRITESQLSTIEQLIQQLKTDRRNWESQAHSLNQSLGQSEKRAGTLNSQLRKERSRYSELQLSFNRYEADQLMIQAEKDREIAGLREQSAAEKLKLQKSRNLNVILGGILGLAAVLLAVFVYVKVRTGGLKALKLFG